MRIDALAIIAGVAAGAAVTTFAAKSQVSSALTQGLKHLGIPSVLVDKIGGDDPIAAVRAVDPATATQLETAWLTSVIGGSAAAVGVYLLVDALFGGE